jgi:hypothetical protein
VKCAGSSNCSIACIVLLYPPFLSQSRILLAGSNFDFYLQDSSNSTNYTAALGVPTTFTFGSVTGTFTETDTTLAGGGDRLTFTWLATSDLFPVAPGGYGYVGIGVFSPLDLSSTVDVTAATLEYTDTVNGAMTGGSFLPIPRPLGTEPSLSRI